MAFALIVADFHGQPDDSLTCQSTRHISLLCGGRLFWSVLHIQERNEPKQMPLGLKRLLRRSLNMGSRMLTSGLGQLTLLRSGLRTNGQVNVERHVRLSVTDGGSGTLGAGVSIDRFATIVIKQGRLDVGSRSYIGQGSMICARQMVTIGTDCLIAEHVTIRDQDHAFGPGLIFAQAGFSTAPVTIGDNVWIGAKATVTKGVSIGDNVVIGANSVVTKDIPANSVAAGSPARVIRQIGDTT